MAGRIDARLTELGIALPTPAVPIATYVPFVRFGDLVVVSGQVPTQDGVIRYTGLVGEAIDVPTAIVAARLAFINVLAQLRLACDGDLDRVARVVRLGGFVAARATFTDHATVMNGASDLSVEVFGEIGRHARSTIGVPSLPRDASVEVEGMFQLLF